jgi:hypothetical protein
LIKLQAKCRARLIEAIVDAVPSLVVNDGMFIYASTAKLGTTDNIIPTSGPVRDQLTDYVNETPVSTFIVDQLRSELLKLNQYQEDTSTSLTEIGGYEDPQQVAERLVDQISSLPWQYKLTIRLPQQLVPLLPPGENSIVLNDQIELVRASDIFQKLYPLETDRASTPTSGLLGLGGPSWEPSAEYMQITANGFIGPYGGSIPAWRAESILRAFCGLGIARRLFKVTHKYPLFEPRPSSHFIKHRQLSDQSWQFEGKLSLSEERSRALDSLEREQFEQDFDIKGFTNYTLSQMRAVFSGGPKADPIILASEWF